MQKSDHSIFHLFQVAGAVICGVVGTYMVIKDGAWDHLHYLNLAHPIESLGMMADMEPNGLIGSGCGAFLGGVGTCANFFLKENFFFEDTTHFVPKAVAATVIGAMVGGAGVGLLAGCVVGGVAGSVVGFPAQKLADALLPQNETSEPSLPSRIMRKIDRALTWVGDKIA